MASSSASVPAGLIKAHKVLQKKEKTPTIVFRTAADANLHVATQIKQLILTSVKKPVVLGLATGSTPVGTELANWFPSATFATARLHALSWHSLWPERSSSQAFIPFKKQKLTLFDGCDLNDELVFRRRISIPVFLAPLLSVDQVSTRS